MPERARLSTSQHLARDAAALVEDALAQSGCVALFGPRRAGKTSLAQALGRERGTGAVTLNLRSHAHRTRVSAGDAFFREHAGKLVILDEAQEMPEAFDLLQVCLDGHLLRADEGLPAFLILGSSSWELRKLVDDALGARLLSVEVGPIQAHEMQTHRHRPTTAGLRLPDLIQDATEDISPAEEDSLDALWLRGGFPESLMAASDEASYRWRQRYLATCFGRGTETSQARTWMEALRSIAAAPGCQIPSSKQSREFRDALDQLEGHFGLVRRLPAWFSNEPKRLRAAPELFIRDTGLLHALRRCKSSADVAANGSLLGASWESFCIEALISAAGAAANPFFYRDDDQNELDLVLEFGSRRWGFEIKHGKSPVPGKRFYKACTEVKVDRRYFVYRGEKSAMIGDGIPALVLADALEEILEQR